MTIVGGRTTACGSLNAVVNNKNVSIEKSDGARKNLKAQIIVYRMSNPFTLNRHLINEFCVNEFVSFSQENSVYVLGRLNNLGTKMMSLPRSYLGVNRKPQLGQFSLIRQKSPYSSY